MVDLTAALKNVTPAQAWAIYQALDQFVANGEDALDVDEEDLKLKAEVEAATVVMDRMTKVMTDLVA